MQEDSQEVASSNSSPERYEDGNALQKSTSRGSGTGKEAMSLKRGREGSLEPHPAGMPQQTPAVTKKNRLAHGSSQGEAKPIEPSDTVVEVDEIDPDFEPDPAVDGLKEGQTVGEVRRKVEQLTHQEEIGKTVEVDASKEKGVANGDDDERMKRTDTRDDSGEWEKIDKAEVEGENEDLPVQGDGPKRKALNRSESSTAKGDGEGDGVKRQKDTPSPTHKGANITPAEPEPPKKTQTSFSAFSSSSSPFATARSASPFTGGALASESAFGSAANATPTKASAFSNSGFGTYSSTLSPFAAKKSAPPAFAAVSLDREKSEENELESEAGPSTFGDILKSGTTRRRSGALAEKDEQKVQMTEQDVPTGEEDEETLYQTRAKLYVMQSDGGWKERGTGTLKLNVRQSDARGARLVMRAEGVFRLILNVSLYAGMVCLEDGKYVRTTVFEENERRFITFRTASNKTAADLSGAVMEAIPLESNSAAASKSPDPRAGTAVQGVEHDEGDTIFVRGR